LRHSDSSGLATWSLYLRPYITEGNVAHFGGGVDFALPHKLTSGLSGFGLEPFGNQVVYSQAVMRGFAVTGAHPSRKMAAE
jgi:hypothetical protein